VIPMIIGLTGLRGTTIRLGRSARMRQVLFVWGTAGITVALVILSGSGASALVQIPLCGAALATVLMLRVIATTCVVGPFSISPDVNSWGKLEAALRKDGRDLTLFFELHGAELLCITWLQNKPLFHSIVAKKSPVACLVKILVSPQYARHCPEELVTYLLDECLPLLGADLLLDLQGAFDRFPAVVGRIKDARQLLEKQPHLAPLSPELDSGGEELGGPITR
jgi:hypothetical protein